MYFFRFQKIPPRVKFRHESDYFTKIPTKLSIFLFFRSSPQPASRQTHCPRVKCRHESDYFTKIPTRLSIFLFVRSSPNPDPLKTSRPSIPSTITTRKFVRQLFTNRTKAEKQSSSCRISRQCEKRL